MEESFTHCSVCVVILGMMKRLAKLSGARKLLSRLAISACIRYEYGGNTTCTRTVRTHEAHFHKLLLESPLTAKQMCQRLDFCEMPQMYDYIREPPVYKSAAPRIAVKRDAKEYLEVTHLSDVHVDLKYRVGSRVDCGEVLCCREDIYLGSNPPTNQRQREGASPFGEPRCDIPAEFLDTLPSEALKKHIFLTGDIGAHDIWNDSMKELLKGHRVCQERVGKGREVWMVLGNHDLMPANYFAYNSTDVSKMKNSTKLLKGIGRIWKLPSTFTKAGYYRKDLGKFCVLTLNSNLYYHFNAHRYHFLMTV